MDQARKDIYINLIKTAIGDENLTSFAARAGLSAGNLSRIRRGQPATPDTLRKIAAASVTVCYEELMDAAGFALDESTGLEETESISGLSAEMILIPLVKDIEATKKKLSLRIKEDRSLEKIIFYAGDMPEGEYFAFEVGEESIAKLSPGDTVLVNMSADVADGDVVLVGLKDEGAVLRRLTESDSQYLLYGDDLSKFPMRKVSRAKAEIYGVVEKAITNL